MGNTLLQPQNARQTNPLKSFDEFLIQNSDLSSKQFLSENKFFRTVRFSIKSDAKIIMKVYLKRSVLSSELLQILYQNFLLIRDRLASKVYPNLFPYMKFINFDQPDEDFLAIVRQSLHSTLQERFHSLPKLSNVEILWILTQVIIGVYNLHSEGLFHGDLKTANVLLTTWNHAFVSDFACAYKPLFIDDISVFRSFFYTSENNCALAPEKFKPKAEDSGSPVRLQDLSKDLLSTMQKMDLFSLGCVIYESFCNGQSLFTYEQLQLYIKGEYDPTETVKRLKETNVQKLVLWLINKDPSKRMSIEDVLKLWFRQIVPDCVFDVLFYIDATLNNPNFSLADERIALFKKLFPLIYEQFIEFNQGNVPTLYENLPIPIQELKITQGLTKSVREVKPNLFELLKKQPPAMLLPSGIKDDSSGRFSNLENLENCRERDISEVINKFKLKKHALNKGRVSINAGNSLLFQKPKKDSEELKEANKDAGKASFAPVGNESLDIIILMICSNLRNLRFSSSKLVALELLHRLSFYVSDSTKFRLICPYLCWFFDDPSINEGTDALIISTAFTIFCEILSSIKDPFITTSDCKLYSAFVWVNIKKVVESEGVDLIQSAFAKNLHLITETCRTFLLETYTKKNASFSQTEPEYLKDLEALKKTLIGFIHNILSHTNYEIQEILLNNLHKLCSCDVFDDKTCDSEIMPLIISCLNKKKQVCLSLAPNIAKNFTPKAVNSMLKPCLEACLYDSDEMVVLETIRCFKEMARMRLMDRTNDEELLKKIVPLVMYPNLWIREEAFNFIGTILEKYSPVEIYSYIQPLLSKYFRENMMLSKEILEFVMPEMLEKDQVRMIREAKQQKNELKFDSKNIELLYHEYLRFVNFQNHNIDNEEAQDFATRLEEINRGNCKSLIQKLNNLFMGFLLDNYPENLVSLMDLVPIQQEVREKKELKLEDLIEAFKNTLMQEQHVDISSPDMSMNKSKILSSWGLKISRDWESSLQKKQRNSFVFRFLQGAVLDINTMLFKMKQFDVRTESVGLDGYSGKSENPIKFKGPANKFWRPVGSLITTIYEHDDVVSCLEGLRDNRRFISGSYDGFIRVFDLEKIENDFTCDSVVAFAEDQPRRVKSLKVIEDSANLLVGTDRDNINHYNIDYLPNGGNKTRCLMGQYEVVGEVRKIENLRMDDERCFIYVTSKGEIGVQDFRSKDATLRFNCGMERGTISTMLVANNGNAACVATLNGYLMLYDLRCNLIYNIFQLCDHDNKPLPIISLGHLPRAQNHVCPDIELINIGFGSNNHELGFWNVINAAQDNLNPLIYMVSTYEENPIFKIPYLVKKEESFTNFNYKYSERSVYEYFSLMSSYNDVLSFLDDPLMRTQNNIKQVWLEESKYTLSRITRLFEYKNTVKKSVGFSQISGGSSNQKTLENVLITVGNDRNIRYWTIQGEMKGQFDKRRLGGHVNNADGRERLFKQEKNGDILIVHEFEKTLNTSVQQGRENESQELWEEGFRYDEKASHKDNIEDVLFVEREKGALIVTGSRDNTIKVWK